MKNVYNYKIPLHNIYYFQTKLHFMRKIYAFTLMLLSCHLLRAQCPVLNGAFVNSCSGVAPNTEGLNEFIAFTTTAQAAASTYVVYYNNSTPPTTAPLGILSGANAGTKNGTGVITSAGGCMVVLVTSGATIIPAGSIVVFIPSNFTNNFDITPFCTNGSIYLVLIDITAASPTPKWSAAGTLGNTPGADFRYLQVKSGSEACTPNIRSYTGGWPTNLDGNFVVWTQQGVATYLNGGCNLITTPVTLLTFTAVGQGKNANIAWQTSSEINTKSFELQQSSDAVNFNTIYTSPAAGHSSSVKSYVFTDLNIAAGPNYYRLKMIDNDGSTTYSKVEKVVSTGNRFMITNLYPSPAVSQLRITWNAAAAGNTLSIVYDLAGRILVSKTVASTAGINYYQLPVSQLPTGAYLLKLVKDGETIVSRFTKQ